MRRGQRQSTDRSQAAKYRNVGAALLESANALQTIAAADTRYGNAIAAVAIHAAIACNDALTIAYAEFKSTEGDHEKAPDALLSADRERRDRWGSPSRRRSAPGTRAFRCGRGSERLEAARAR